MSGLYAAASNKSIERNARQIMSYLENVHHRILPGGGVPDVPMGRKERGGSRPPLAESAMDLAEANAQFTAVVGTVMRPRHFPAERIRGIPAWRILSDVLFDPTAVRRWRARRLDGDAAPLRAFEELCLLLAAIIAARHGAHYRLPYVVTSPRRAAEILAEQQADPRKEAPKVRRLTARDSYRAIVADMERMVEQGYSKRAAKVTKAEQLGCSIGRIHDAISAVNKERRTLFGGRWDEPA